MMESRLRWWLCRPLDFCKRIAGEVYFRLHPDEPWMSHHAVRFCRKILNTNMIGLEWGSGRSTLWFARHLKHLTSIEHNPEWFAHVTTTLRNAGATNVNYRHVPLDHPVDEPTVLSYSQQPKYVDVVQNFAPDSLDFVVVDGHYRQACIQAIPAKLKVGGYLLVDNSNWMALEEWKVPTHWPVVHRSFGFFGETTIWQKQ